ncbi:MAG: BTAD domain-containing putative transcriptional regulator, partial [Actinomycetota bacterium]
MQALWNHRLGLVIAPAGSGKTTLLAHVAAASPAAVGWYRAEGIDDEQTLLAYLQTAVGAVEEPAWRTVEDAARGLEQRCSRRTLLVVDDVHCIAGTPAEAALARVVDYAPPGITFLLSSRYMPDLNVSRLRVAGEVLEVNADDLRFRTWEVERLFRDCYDDPLTPEELARVTHRTEGWAAGLQLFHLASHGKSHAERRRLITALSGRSR